jgi:hypothetical protein
MLAMAVAKKVIHAKRKAPKRTGHVKLSPAEEALLEQEARALLEKINRGIDEAHARLDRMLAKYEA